MNKTLMFYINAINGGGAARVIVQLARHFADSGYESILVTSFEDESFEYKIPDKVKRISIEKEEIKQSAIKRNVSRIVALRKLCKQYKPCALISFMAEPNFRAVLASAGLPIKNIVSVRNDPKREYAGLKGAIVGKFVIPRADGCVFQTEEAKAWFSKRFQKKSRVIFNDVDKVFFETEYVGGKDIVTLGRLAPQKNQKMLIKAFAAIADRYPKTNLRIYGRGVLQDELEELVENLNLTERVRFMGQTADASAVLSKAGCFALSSDYEGMPNALLEALAIGVPSVSTDCPCGGPKMLINNGENGLLVSVGDEKGFAKALDDLLSDSEFAKILGKNAKCSAQGYKTENVFNQWKNYIESIVNS